jgi:hypothetical protein
LEFKKDAKTGNVRYNELNLVRKGYFFQKYGFLIIYERIKEIYSVKVEKY